MAEVPPAVLGFFTWLAAVVRRRGLAGAAVRGALIAHDEVFHVTAHEAAYEIRAQAERKVPVVSPGGRQGGAGRRTLLHRGRARRRRTSLLRRGGPRRR